MEFLKEVVSNERTGANISPITVDTQSRYIINPINSNFVSVPRAEKIPEHRNMFLDMLESIAKESEQINLKNNKAKLDLGLEKLDLEFKEKWANVNDKFTNKEIYNKYLEDFEEYKNKGKALIADSDYFSNDEKLIKTEEYDMRKRTDRIGINEQRNKMYIAQQVQDTSSLIDQYTNIAGTYDLNSDERAFGAYRKMADLYKDLGKLTNTSPQKISELLANKIGEAETLRLDNHLSSILENPSLTISDKKNKLNEIQKYLNRDDILDGQIKEFVDTIKPTNVEIASEDLKIALKGHNLKAIKKYQNQLTRLEKEQEAYNKLLKQKSQLDNDFDDATFSKLQQSYKKQTGKILKNEDIINGVVSIDWAKAGDLNDTDIVEIFDKRIMKGLRKAVNDDLTLNGGNVVKANMIVIDEIDKLLENDNTPYKELKRNAFLKQYADSTDYKPLAFVNLKEYPEMLEVSQAMKLGDNIIKDIEPKDGFWSFVMDFGISDKEIFDKKASELSPILATGRNVLKRIIASEMLKDGINKEDFYLYKDDYIEKIKTGDYDRKIEASRQLQKKNRVETPTINKSRYGL